MEGWTELGHGPVAEFVNRLMKFSRMQNGSEVLNK
jgi:hypothetical protein